MSDKLSSAQSACPPDPQQNRRAKIICTIGPSCSTEATLRQLVQVGMDVARLNFSHGSHLDHARHIETLRRVAAEEDKTICVLQDLQGPKIRTGMLKDHQPVTLKTGGQVTITTRDVEGTAELISTTFKGLADEVKPETCILLSDGRIELRVTNVIGDDIECKVINGGTLGENQGINLPGAALSIPALTEKDRKDLEFGLEHGVDVIALSFVRSAADVMEAKQIIAAQKKDVPVIAKLEKPQALDQLEQILEACDGVMVARGDLGVEMPPEKVPVIQKHVIRRASEWRKPVIIATQMLESMIENPRPTRAEASDVANAVFDGADAVMLSGETASGRYPIESVQMMDRIVLAAESAARTTVNLAREIEAPLGLPSHFPDVIARVACEAAQASGATLIAAFTLSGVTARLLAHYRPSVPIVAFSPNQEVRRRLALLWGVVPRVLEPIQETEAMVRRVEEELLARGLAQKGERIVIVYGAPVGQPGKINSLRLHTIGT
jgi:pyruvate kinase